MQQDNLPKIEYRLVRSQRKTIGIEITPDGLVIVRAPKRASKSTINEVLRERYQWILDHQKKAIERKKEKEDYLSEAKPITIEEVRELADRMREEFVPRVREYATRLGINYGGITIRNQRTRWGSCSSQGGLNFNCLLMLMPPDVMDSVIVHELCHLKEPNHSERFYAEVLRVFPDYRKCEKWLKENGPALMRRMTGD